MAGMQLRHPPRDVLTAHQEKEVIESNPTSNANLITLNVLALFS